MTSFELFKLLKLKKSCILHIFSYFFLLKYNLCDKLQYFMKKNHIFSIKLWQITGFKIKLCKKSCRKEKWAGLKNLICIKFKCL